jgi:predicted DNA-binding transcriptional regulator AlpA
MEKVNIHITPDGRVSRRDAAAFLGMTAKTLSNWMQKGFGPQSVRVGGRRFYWLSDFRCGAGSALMPGRHTGPKGQLGMHRFSLARALPDVADLSVAT